MKRWRCKICGYIHVGIEPPESCPLCAAGRKFFEEIEEEPVTAQSIEEREALQQVLFKIPCGVFIVSSILNLRPNGMINNTVFQITDDPLQLLLGMEKRHLTAEYILKSGIFAVNFISSEQLYLVKRFGFESGRTMNKFEDLAWGVKVSGAPILEIAPGYLECKIQPDKTMDAGTHLVFLAEVIAGDARDAKLLTYQEYRERKKELWNKHD